MKKVLVISYHYLPLDVIASYRAKAYMDHFYKLDLFPTLITHRWERNENMKDGSWNYHSKEDDIVYESFDSHEIYRIPRTATKPSFFGGFLSTRMRMTYRMANGDLDSDLGESYNDFKRFLFSHLQNHSYDLVLAIFSPHYHLKLAYEINKVFKIPYVLDFRDLWNNELASPSYRPKFKGKIIDKLIKFYWNKWLKRSLFFTITNKYWLDIIENFSGVEGHVVTNGFEKLSKPLDFKNKKFTILFTGSLYKYQDVNIFIEGLCQFIKASHPVKIKVIFVGLREFYWPGIKALLQSKIPSEYLNIKEKVPKVEVMRMIEAATLLYFPGFENIKGWCSAKVFDYLSSRKNILLCPSDNGIVHELLVSTATGLIANNPQEVKEILSDAYKEWEKQGILSYNGNMEEIMKYSRENQVKLFSKYIMKAISS